MGYLLFLLVNAVLFLRPAEIIPQLENLPFYEVLILACLLVSLGRVASQLSLRSLCEHPISAFVVGQLGAVFISAMLNPDNEAAFPFCIIYAKLLCYYLLLVAVVDTPARLRGFVYCLSGLILLITGLALLQYHGVINIPALASYAEKQWEFVDPETGQSGEVLVRLCAAGIFSNPNDFSRILSVGMLISLYGWSDKDSPVPPLVWLVVFGAFGYAMALTHSRGGFLGLLAGLVAFLWGRYGTRKALGLAAVVLPLFVLLFSGRQTSISTGSGTGFLRIMLWSDAFEQLREAPFFGIGFGDIDDTRPNTHNSFVQAYVGLGLIGGTIFFGALYTSLLLPYRAGRPESGLPKGELRRFCPYLLGIIAGYVVGMLSSSRNSVPPTYMLLGLATAYMRFAGVYLPPTLTRLNGPLVRHVLLATILFVIALYLFIRISLAQS
jgi:hypothetical protein